MTNTMHTPAKAPKKAYLAVDGEGVSRVQVVEHGAHARHQLLIVVVIGWKGMSGAFVLGVGIQRGKDGGGRHPSRTQRHVDVMCNVLCTSKYKAKRERPTTFPLPRTTMICGAFKTAEPAMMARDKPSAANCCKKSLFGVVGWVERGFKRAKKGGTKVGLECDGVCCESRKGIILLMSLSLPHDHALLTCASAALPG